MTKSELVKAMAEKTGSTQKDTEVQLKALGEVIKETISKRDKIQIIGYGSIEVVPTNARVGRNPKTNEEMPIPAGEKVKVKLGKAIKDLVK